MAMNARSSENYLAISSKSVKIFWAEIYQGRFFRAESSLIQSSCRSFIRVSVTYKCYEMYAHREKKVQLLVFWDRSRNGCHLINYRHCLQSWHFLMKLTDNFQMSEHSWPCRFHIIIIKGDNHSVLYSIMLL
jgi:hypothetical protein